MNVNIQELKDGLVRGVKVILPEDMETNALDWYQWTTAEAKASFDSPVVNGIIVKAWKHVPTFQEVEYHGDTETQFFISGDAIMVFLDIENDLPIMESVQVVHIRPGTMIVIEKGKGHFVPVAKDDTPVIIAVTIPPTDFPHILLDEPIVASW